MLYQWIDELAPGMRKRAKPHKSYDDSDRTSIVAVAYADGGAVAESIKKAGIDQVIFHNWRRKLLGDEVQKMVDDLRSEDMPDEGNKLREMIEKQRRELRRLQLETAVWKEWPS